MDSSKFDRERTVSLWVQRWGEDPVDIKVRYPENTRIARNQPDVMAVSVETIKVEGLVHVSGNGLTQQERSSFQNRSAG